MKVKAQLENGYTKIANELIDALCLINLNSYETRILMCIIRKTYGFNKKEDWIANSQIVKQTNIYKSHVSRTIKRLKNRKIVTQTGNLIKINTSTSDWLPNEVTAKKLPNEVTQLPNEVTRVTYVGNKKLPNEADTKETKETIQKKLIQNNIINNITKDKSFGNPDINLILELLKKQIGSPILDGSIKVNRQYANLLIKKSKTGVDGVKWLIGLINAKDRYCPTIGSTKDLYYKTNKLVQYKGGRDQNQDGKLRGSISYEDFIKMDNKTE